MHHQLLGGWRHVADDVRRLAKGLSDLPDTCTCGRGSAHLAGTCPCCLGGERALDNGCTDCEVLLASIRAEMDELVDATLRFLPFVEASTAAAGETTESASVHDLRRQIFAVADVSQRLETAAGDFRTGCSASHVPVLKALASQLASATTELGAQLSATSSIAWRATG